MPEQTCDVVRPRVKSEGHVIERVIQPLERSIEIRSGCVYKKEMVETLGYQPPAAKQRVAQDQGGVVPDKTVAHSGRIANEDGDEENYSGPDLFHDKRGNQ